MLIFEAFGVSVENGTVQLVCLPTNWVINKAQRFADSDNVEWLTTRLAFYTNKNFSSGGYLESRLQHSEKMSY